MEKDMICIKRWRIIADKANTGEIYICFQLTPNRELYYVQYSKHFILNVWKYAAVVR